MRISRTRPVAVVAIAAALSLAASPVMARGWGGHRHHDRGIDGGDVLAGLLVIGGIAAIASVASSKSKESREADYRYPDRNYPDRDYRADEGPHYVPPVDQSDYRGDRNYSAADRNLDSAVDSCVGEVECSDRRVDSVDSVNRSSNGWTVEGRADGRDFTCSVDGAGSVRGVTVGGSAI